MRVAWAGRVSTGSLDTDYLLARQLQRALEAGGAPGLDRRRAIAALWERLLGLSEALAGKRPVLAMLAEDAEGGAVSGVGLGALWAVHHGCLAEPWVEAPHPLLGAPHVPDGRPGALTVEALPPYLLALGADGSASTDPRGHRAQDLRPLCGVRR